MGNSIPGVGGKAVLFPFIIPVRIYFARHQLSKKILVQNRLPIFKANTNINQIRERKGKITRNFFMQGFQ